MSYIITLGSLSLDVSEVSEISDEGYHVRVYVDEQHDPPQIYLTGLEAELLREWCDEQKWLMTPAAAAGLPRARHLQKLPRLRCDFTTIGQSGQADDPCVYTFDETILDYIPPDAEFTVFAFMDDNSAEHTITGCEAILERYPGGWRVRPDPATWYSGPRFW
jgi:hypothetical protein